MARYHSGKLYLPKNIREELGLENGDQMEITARHGKIIASPLRGQNPDEVLARFLTQAASRATRVEKPVRPPWRRRDIYGRGR